MRITNGMMIDSFLVNMQNNLTQMNKYTNQLASNRKIVRLSDDPVGVLNALTARNRLARIEQFQVNLNTAAGWVEQCDSGLQELSAKIQDIREQVVSSATTVKTNEDRQNISALCKELKNSIIETLNSTVGNQYLFAGFNTTNEPFTLIAGKVLYNGLDLTDMTPLNSSRIAFELNQHIQIEVGHELTMDVTLNGAEVVGWGDDNMFEHLDEIIDLMEDPNISPTEAAEKLSDKLGNLDKIHTRITKALAKVGAMESKVKMLDDRYAEDVINYNEMRSKIEDIDSAEVIMDWKMAEAVYKQSLSTGARIIMPTLMDFLN